jgi:hypothetical protein
MNQKTKELLKSELGTLMHYCKYSQTALDGVCKIIKILKLNSQDKIQKSPEMQYKQMQMSKSFTQSPQKCNLAGESIEKVATSKNSPPGDTHLIKQELNKGISKDYEQR